MFAWAGFGARNNGRIWHVCFFAKMQSAHVKKLSNFEDDGGRCRHVPNIVA